MYFHALSFLIANIIKIMDFNLLVSLVVTGVVIGTIYSLIAMGLSLIWGVSRIINIAHGEFIIIGAYTTYFMQQAFGGDPSLYLIPSGLVVGLLGILVQVTLYNKIVGKDHLTSLVLAYGVSIVLTGALYILYTGNLRILNSFYSSKSVHFGSIILRWGEIYGFFVALLFIGIVYFLLEKSDTGRAIRAIAQDKDAAVLMGINPNKIYMIAMFISAFLAGVAGHLVAVLYSFSPGDGESRYLGISFVITVLAGLGSIKGLLLSGIIILVAQNLTSTFAQGLETAMGFLLMILFIIYRPRGFFGKSID